MDLAIASTGWSKSRWVNPLHQKPAQSQQCAATRRANMKRDGTHLRGKAHLSKKRDACHASSPITKLYSQRAAQEQKFAASEV
jgi:hypothetical protein